MPFTFLYAPVGEMLENIFSLSISRDIIAHFSLNVNRKEKLFTLFLQTCKGYEYASENGGGLIR